MRKHEPVRTDPGKQPDPATGAQALPNARRRADQTRRLAFALALVLVLVGVVWETLVAPIRPGAWSLSLKMLPLALGLPSLLRGTLRAYQGWSMGVLIYVAEGVTRVFTDRGASAMAAAVELGLSLLLFGTILVHVRRDRAMRSAAPAEPALR